ncbi:hypothetical protein Scep_003599 [Stephania cephalantha]|uniref:Uncharacterized protein n=1 Tax=Stephania cephalantha TaxID=152367 RepID=A0AAP0KRQ8_9MAGN
MRAVRPPTPSDVCAIFLSSSTSCHVSAFHSSSLSTAASLLASSAVDLPRDPHWCTLLVFRTICQVSVSQCQLVHSVHSSSNQLTPRLHATVACPIGAGHVLRPCKQLPTASKSASAHVSRTQPPKSISLF